MKALKCRECGREYPLTATHVCEFDFGPLEVAYDYDRIKHSLTRAGHPVAPANACGVIANCCPSPANRPWASKSATRR